MTKNNPKKLMKVPIIKSTFEPRGPLFVVLLVQNIGDAAAVDVCLEFQFEPSDSKRRVLLPLLMPRQKIRLIPPEGNMKTLAEKFTTLKLGGECRDVYGEKYQIDDKIDIKQVIQSWLDAHILLEETVANRLSVIADRMDRLERTMHRMLSLGRGVLVKTRKDEETEEEEFKKQYEEERKQKEEEEKKKTSSAS
jgi:hypothetical protein